MICPSHEPIITVTFTIRLKLGIDEKVNNSRKFTLLGEKYLYSKLAKIHLRKISI